MKPIMRHKARYHAVQALYQSLMSGDDAAKVMAEHRVNMKETRVDVEHFTKLVREVIAQQQRIDEAFSPYLKGRTLDELTPIELCVLRIATFEMLECLDVPYQVVINEALELNKAFGTEEGYKFVNAVLDHVAQKLRPIEKK
jgi:N utilization substance protein B